MDSVAGASPPRTRSNGERHDRTVTRGHALAPARSAPPRRQPDRPVPAAHSSRRLPIRADDGGELQRRKTGRRYSVPLSAHRIDDDLYTITSAPWKHNFRDGAAAEVLLKGKTTTMRGELIQDRAVIADLARHWRNRHSPVP